MANADYQSLYSCKRKKDIVTFCAISFFVLLILFQLYLVFVAPVILAAQSKNNIFLEKEVLFAELDELHNQLRSVPVRGELQAGEKELVKEILDLQRLYVRENQDAMTIDQVRQVKDLIAKYRGLIRGWEANRFHIVRESIDSSAVLKLTEDPANSPQ